MRVKQISMGYEHIELQFYGDEGNYRVALVSDEGDPLKRARHRVNIWTWTEATAIADAINEEKERRRACQH